MELVIMGLCAGNLARQLAIYSDLEGTSEPTRCLPWTVEALSLHPDNKFIMPAY